MQGDAEHTAMQQHALSLFDHSLGYTPIDGTAEETGPCTVTGRQRASEVVLIPRLRAALRKLNPGCEERLLDKAIDELTRDRRVLSLARANQEIYLYLKDGVKIDQRSGTVAEAADRHEDKHKTVRVINWTSPEENDFVLVSHFWVNGQLGNKCLDLVGFVNGLPFILFTLQDRAELQDLYARVNDDYKQNIAPLFWYNAFIVVSNGFVSKLGSLTTPWERFSTWKRIKDEREVGSTSLETLILGTCDKTRLLDIVENFTLFDQAGGLKKLIAMNHQYLGVNNAFKVLKEKKPEERGKLGVFWHTQGSGKSYSMVFFARKVLRKLGGDYTFVIVTDRNDLDQQIYDNFHNVGAIIELPKDVRANDGKHLQQLLSQDHRIVFTLIQKFRAEKPGSTYPELSSRDNIIVITDEAHRSEYDTLAQNMRDALPKAAFIGFTGTPLMGGEEQTRETFGDYVSKYNFRRAIQDGITVPLFYENHTPPMDLVNENFHEDMTQLLEQAMLEPEQIQKVEEQYARENYFLVKNERLEWVADDIVTHFMGRGYMGKAMVVSIDKITTVRMYNKVYKYWLSYLERLRQQLLQEHDPEERQHLSDKIAYMEQTQMAVVVSASDSDNKKFAEFEQKTGEKLDIALHHQRFREGKLEGKFKKDSDPLHIVFVCAMWMTGFDVSSLSTLYLDRPLRNHTLMQAIARPNRVFEDKSNGLIVDYVGTVHDLEEALSVYAREESGAIDEKDRPIGDKSELIQTLCTALSDITVFCQEQGIDITALLAAVAATGNKQEQKDLIMPDVDRLVANDEIKLRYLVLALDVRRFYKAILPDNSASKYTAQAYIHHLIETEIYDIMRTPGIGNVLEHVTRLVDASIEMGKSELRESLDGYSVPGSFNLSDIDLDALAIELKTGYRHIKAEQMRGLLSEKLKRMIKTNNSRINYLQKLQRAIDRYNESSANEAIDPPLIQERQNIISYPVATTEQTTALDELGNTLVELAGELAQEEQRSQIEQFTEEELAIYDIVVRDIQLTEEEREASKGVIRELSRKVNAKIAKVTEWHVKEQTRNQIYDIVQVELNKLPPDPVFTKEQYDQKCQEVFLYILEHYSGTSVA